MRRSKSGPASHEASRGNFTPPSRAAAPPSAEGHEPSPPSPSPRGSRFSVQNWRVPAKLNAILLIPVLVGLVLGLFQVNGSINTLQEANEAERTARLVRAAATYGHLLLDERDVTAAPLLAGDRDSKVVTEARAASDAARQDFEAAVQDMPERPGLNRRLDAYREVEPQLESLRENAYTSKLPGVQTEENYVRVQHVLMEFANELGLGTGNVTSYGRTVYAISLTKAALSLERSIGMHLLVKPGPDAASRGAQLTAFSSYAYLENIALGEYVGGGTPQDQQLLESELRNAQEKGKEKVEEAKRQADAAGTVFIPPPSFDKMVTSIATNRNGDELKEAGITPETWFATATGKFDAYRSVEKKLVDAAVAETRNISGDAQREAIITGVLVVLALLAAFILAGMTARSMSRSMQRLRNAAFDVAEQRLPGLVDQLSRTDPGRVDTRVEPIPITSRDEIGEVARAFDQVHREAVRLASEQALLRGNVNAIFTNLSRRNQGLIERQLNLITDLENNEADPDQLENLFKMDHLATRMRRNGENLLVLAGEEPGRRWNQPVPLIDVLRAAASEVEQYERIELSGVPETEIHGTAVSDLVHLLAELLENATSFSSPQTKVRVTATRLPDGRIMVEIHDKGIGLTAEDFADINHKLANPPTVDVAVARRMGLFVVGRLADRHGIRVQLRPSGEQAGTTSLVMLPENITHGGGGEQPPEDDFTVSRIVPEQPQAYGGVQEHQIPARTAAELGFDESRYERAPDDARELDSVGRSRLREERRAQLEASAEQQPVYRDEREPQGYHQEAPQEPQGYEAEYPRAAYPEQDYAGQDFRNSGYQDAGYQQNGYPDAAYGEAAPADQQSYSPFGTQPAQTAQPAQDRWSEPFGGGDRYEPDHGPESEPSDAPADRPESVGFERPGSSSSGAQSLTGAGLPRRDKAWQPSGEREQKPQETSPTDDPDWRSANDDRWHRAERLREPKAGGVTPSGLPRRVPKANLVEGTAEQTPQGGPSVSRAPEDVRGRLSNLRRGVQRGRNAGTDTGHQGFGPGGSSTYDQER
ncbi:MULTISPECIES: nitrate- and nitrite sensing domain-containing protein [Streptomyces]|uniref:histidine kinase n=2 Tax=Streptomyces TaxID=1883 RepID=A0A420V823_9ACTN|nr:MULTISPECIES: nitrate- and nitrite sensing domain-containing protein [Streptomyces]KNE79252.1 ATPase [Streptomyces fradiae]OFA33930.1 ATPase [Streptomyces fradiae]PQM24444.1 HAMP domain-containing protein [Streptomyces xinghaiensis]RKM98112.1 HAMP domain-containing protein [Streptomyces xinghaiensis]RNC75193.1 HAMP domain-containing protein [Streptomyces xinghaiensis]